jgi:hypothetical protein
MSSLKVCMSALISLLRFWLPSAMASFTNDMSSFLGMPFHLGTAVAFSMATTVFARVVFKS